MEIHVPITVSSLLKCKGHFNALPSACVWFLCCTVRSPSATSCHGKAEECMGLCRALLGATVWLLQGCAWYCERLREQGESAGAEAGLHACLQRLEGLLQSTKNKALIHIARLEEPGEGMQLIHLNANMITAHFSPLGGRLGHTLSPPCCRTQFNTLV